MKKPITIDVLKHLVLILDKGNLSDKTEKIEYIEEQDEKVRIKYNHSETEYSYNKERVAFYKITGEIITPEESVLYYNNFPKDFDQILHFGEYVKVKYRRKSELYPSSEVKIQSLNDHAPEYTSYFEYFKTLADHLPEMKKDQPEDTDSDEIDPAAPRQQGFISKSFDKINIKSTEHVLSDYLEGKYKKYQPDSHVLIYPFGCNANQKEAVRNAFSHNITAVEGPPGTGKTQTILNIIANAVIRGKSVGIVSGNNSATANVQEKLVDKGYGFLTALLGNSANQGNFINQQIEQATLPSEWKQDEVKINVLKRQIDTVSNIIDKYLNDQNRIARLRQELAALELENSHFEKEVITDVSEEVFRKIFIWNWDSRQILKFKVFYENTFSRSSGRSFLMSLRLLIQFGIFELDLFYQNLDQMSFYLDRKYYQVKRGEYLNEIETLSQSLERVDFKQMLKTFSEASMIVFNNSLYESFSDLEPEHFAADKFKNSEQFPRFIRRYPVILSTTHSILNSIQPNYLFDYLIIDESSQVDLLTATLAFSCCRNIVIIGDTLQLTHIVDSSVQALSDELRKKGGIPDQYDYVQHNILSSLKAIYKDSIPVTLLKEHYRCHPAIIDFCNRKFYNNELIIMTRKEDNNYPFLVYSTVKGNHSRTIISDKGKKRPINERQMSVIQEEILEGVDVAECNHIGIISPYRYQADELQKRLELPIEVDTIHKFQGREKDKIIFMTVANEITRFLDNPNLINVAVSRAKKQFVIVKPHDMRLPHGSNFGDLLRYIRYISVNQPEVFIESKIISVFDILYSEYSDELYKFRKRSLWKSKYDTENIMYELLMQIIAEEKEFSCFTFIINYPLSVFIQPGDDLTPEEENFVFKTCSHVDFVIYNRIDNTPVLVIEIDGTRYHLKNEKQIQRDRLKDSILTKRGIAVQRLSTNGSHEKEIIISRLREVKGL